MTRRRLIPLLGLTLSLSACGARVDQQKFDRAYRAAKALELSMASGVHLAESRALVQQLRVETAVLHDRTSNKPEADAVQAYEAVVDAYDHYLIVTEKVLSDEAPGGKMLLGDGWIPTAKKYNIPFQPHPDNGREQFNFYWVDAVAAEKNLAEAGKNAMTEGNRLVNGK